MDVYEALKEFDIDNDEKFTYDDFKEFMQDIMDRHAHEPSAWWKNQN